MNVLLGILLVGSSSILILSAAHTSAKHIIGLSCRSVYRNDSQNGPSVGFASGALPIPVIAPVNDKIVERNRKRSRLQT